MTTLVKKQPAEEQVIDIPGDAQTFMKLVVAGIITATAYAFVHLSGGRLQPPIAKVPPAEPDEVMSADEVAEFLGVDRNTVYDYAGRGVIPHQRLGKRILFRRGALLSWLEGCSATSTRKGRSMPVRRTSDGRWRYRHVVHYPDGTRERISGSAPTHINTKAAAEQAMRDHIERCLHPERVPSRKEYPSFKEWFDGRFWTEWVVSRKNKPSEVESKKSIMKIHLEPEFGEMGIDEIDVSAIARFRAKLIQKKKSDKTINNILAVLSKALKYAEAARVIDHAPTVGLLKVERPEIVAWSVEEYARLLAAAKKLDPIWFAAVCLAGGAGLRVGEIRALDWRRDVDLIAGTITVNAQIRRGKETTPKGRTRRKVPMTPTLLAALKSLDTIRRVR